MTAKAKRTQEFEGIAATCVGNRLRRVSRIVTGIYDDALRPSGLKSTQYHQLAALSLGGQVTVKELAARLAVDRTSLTRSLEPLTRDGFVTSSAGEDGRERLLSLTKLGQSKLKEATPMWKAAQEAVSETLGAKDAEKLVDALKTIESVLHGD